MTYRGIGVTGLTIALVAAILAAVFGLWPLKEKLQAGSWLQTPQPVGDFRLLDQHNRPFTSAGFKDRWSVVFIGFTHCPDVCPTTLSLLQAVHAHLLAENRNLQTVFITVDPDRDTPAVMARYLSHFSPQFIGVTGEKAAIDRLCSVLKAGYVKNPGVGGEYAMDHSATLFLVDPRARAVAYFKPPLDLDRLTADLRSIVR